MHCTMSINACIPGPMTGRVLQRVNRRTHAFKVSARFGGLGEFFQSLLPKAGDKNDGRAQAKKNLLQLIEGQQRGVKTSKSQRAEIEDAVDALEAFAPATTTTDALLSATWRLVWTSERETLFLIEKGLAFVGPTGDVLQVIDLEEGTLNNVVEFNDGTAAFIVDSTAEVSGDTRVDFKFTSAGLKTPKRSFGLPPFGQGWFENVYVDGDLRVARDSRGDTLIVEKSRVPWDRSAYEAEEA